MTKRNKSSNVKSSARRIARFPVCLLATVSLLLSASQARLVQSATAGQTGHDTQSLDPGKPLERQIAVGQEHTYRIALQAGQFMRAVVEQKGIDVVATLIAPDGKQVAEADISSNAFGLEPISHEAAASGDYRLAVRPVAATALAGAYQVRLEVKAVATAEDKKRIAAERLLAEAARLGKQGASTVEQTVRKAEQALPLWRELGDRYWEAITLNHVGRAYSSGGKFDRALEYYEQALPIHQEVKNRTGEGNALDGLGTAHWRLGRYERAIQHFERALALFHETKDRRAEGGVLNGLGIQHFFLGRYEKAIERFEQALAIARETNDRRGEGIELNGLGNTYNALGRTEEAARNFEQSLVIQREVKNRNGEGTALNNLGIGYYYLGQFEKAIERYEQALAIFRETKNGRAEGGVLNGLGSAYSTMGRFEKAIEYQEQALAIQREEKDRNSQAVALTNLGRSHQRLGRYDKAIEYQEQALAIWREMKERSNEAASLNNLGSAEDESGRRDKAIAHFEQALVIYREVKQRVGEGGVLFSLGVVHTGLGNYEKANEYLVEALTIQREVKDRFNEARLLSGLGTVERLLGHNDKAAEYCEKALAIYRETRARDNEASVLLSLALVERARGNSPQARAYVEGSLKLAESLRADLVSKEWRWSFLGQPSAQDAYRLYIDLLMHQHGAEPAKGFDVLAVEASERARARGLIEMLAEARVDVRQGVDPALLERERVLGRLLNNKAQRLTERNTPEQLDALRKEVSQLENDYERAQASIRKSSPHYAALVQPQPLKLQEIQQQLDVDTLLLEYALGQERSYLWAITKDSLTSYELPKEEQIKQSALAVYELLTARSSNQRGETPIERRNRIAQAEARLPAAAVALSNTLLAPAAAQLGNKRVVIVADGALQYIPFAMLPTPEIGRVRDRERGRAVNPQSAIRNPQSLRPLIVSHEVITLSSASALAIQRSEMAGRQPAPKLLAVIADPVFDQTDPRFKTVATDASDKAQPPIIALANERTIEHLAEKSNDKSGGATRRLVIPRLPYTRQEADQLMALAPKTDSFRAIDFQASRATVLSPELGQYRYLHFATHGLLDSERPGLSALVLSMVDEQGKPQDGFLRSNDIYNLKLPAELVVLSACQTGLGKEIKGEGLIGLTRGFMHAGAARVVVSLWNVNDKATSELMTRFYQKILKENQRPAAALRAAQVEMWKLKAWQSPYYWAAFVLQGEWR